MVGGAESQGSWAGNKVTMWTMADAAQFRRHLSSVREHFLRGFVRGADVHSCGAVGWKECGRPGYAGGYKRARLKVRYHLWHGCRSCEIVVQAIVVFAFRVKSPPASFHTQFLNGVLYLLIFPIKA